jgi:hypothetical protein
MGALVFTISPDREHRPFSKTVEDGSERDELAKFTKGQVPYSDDWIEVDNDVWIRRAAILSVYIAAEGPMFDVA